MENNTLILSIPPQIEEIKKLDNLLDNIINLFVKKYHLKGCVDFGISYRNGENMDWNDFLFIEIEDTKLSNGQTISSVFFFGDGTIEFQDDELEEAFNVFEFDVNDIELVYNKLLKAVGE